MAGLSYVASTVISASRSPGKSAVGKVIDARCLGVQQRPCPLQIHAHKIVDHLVSSKGSSGTDEAGSEPKSSATHSGVWINGVEISALKAITVIKPRIVRVAACMDPTLNCCPYFHCLACPHRNIRVKSHFVRPITAPKTLSQEALPPGASLHAHRLQFLGRLPQLYDAFHKGSRTTNSSYFVPDQCGNPEPSASGKRAKRIGFRWKNQDIHICAGTLFQLTPQPDRSSSSLSEDSPRSHLVPSRPGMRVSSMSVSRPSSGTM